MDSDPFRVTQTVYDEIVAHAREGKPEEVCGILRGRDGQAFALVRGRNVAADPVRDYEVDAQTLLRQFDFEEDGDEMVGIYHSHPVSPAYPSASDAWSAYYPDCVYLICSLADEMHAVVRAFRLMPHAVSLSPGALHARLGFDETRPGRFAYYQPTGAPLPPGLPAVISRVPQPFYVVYESAAEWGDMSQVRVVSVSEKQVQITSI
jgi:[CysO sulfur-carrier protein]-S-L-cysteine hydrolase